MRLTLKDFSSHTRCASSSRRATRCVPFLASVSPAKRPELSTQLSSVSSSVRSIQLLPSPRLYRDFSLERCQRVRRRAFSAAMDLPPPPPTLPPPPQVSPLPRTCCTHPHHAAASTSSAFAGSGGATGVRCRGASHARSQPQPCPYSNWQPWSGSKLASSAPAARSEADERLWLSFFGA
jgi:hypothetical protein